TIGRSRFSAGFNSMHARYGSLAGLSLSNGDLRGVRAAFNADGSPANPFADPIRVNLTADTIVGFLSYGVTDELDIGVAVPWVRVTLGVDATLLTFNGTDITPGGHALVMPGTTAQGLGDIDLFAKYHFLHRSGSDLATQVEVHLPTGDVNN